MKKNYKGHGGKLVPSRWVSPFFSISLLSLQFVSFNAKSSRQVFSLVGKTGSWKYFAGLLIPLAVLGLI